MKKMLEKIGLYCLGTLGVLAAGFLCVAFLWLGYRVYVQEKAKNGDYIVARLVNSDKFQPSSKQAIVAADEVVKVQNPTPIRWDEDTYSREAGSSCKIKRGGRVEIVNSRGQDYLVKYEIDDVQILEYSPCPSGTIFYMSKQEFEGSTAQYRVSRERELRGQRETDALLK